MDYLCAQCRSAASLHGPGAMDIAHDPVDHLKAFRGEIDDPEDAHGEEDELLQSIVLAVGAAHRASSEIPLEVRQAARQYMEWHNSEEGQNFTRWYA